MSNEHDALPGFFVQAIHKILGCPFKIMIQPDTAYPKAGKEIKYYVRITTKDIAARNHCETILRAMDIRVARLMSEETKLHCQLFASDIQRIKSTMPKPSCASKLESYLKKIFKEIKFNSALTDFTVEYIATVNSNNLRSFLQVLTNLGIDDWETVDNEKAVAFTLARIKASEG